MFSKILAAVLFLFIAFVAFAESKREIGFYTSEQRLDTIKNAVIFDKTLNSIEQIDVLKGPHQNNKDNQLGFNDWVSCEYQKPEAGLKGNTPKFNCEIKGFIYGASPGFMPSVEQEFQPASITGDVVKVKYNPDGKINGEVFAEVAATRLLWSLGYFADAMYPVKVFCIKCPEDPFKGLGDVSSRPIGDSAIERKFPGKELTELKHPDQGWKWKEFQKVSAAPIPEKYGLILLAAFIQHSDNKAEQQRLVCLENERDSSTTDLSKYNLTDDAGDKKLICSAPAMLLQDVGTTFGGGGATSSGKTATMNLNHWNKYLIWEKYEAGKTCLTRLHKSMKGDLGSVGIPEEARRFLTARLGKLSDSQIRDIFVAARVTDLTEDRGNTVEGWVAEFKRKRDAITDSVCPWAAEMKLQGAEAPDSGTSSMKSFLWADVK